jgi:hypothetical protein
MAQWTEGAYGASLIGSITGVGTTAMVKVPFEWDLALHLETGFKGEMNKPPPGLIPGGSNEHARAIEGSTLAAHAHAGLNYAEAATLSLHYITTWSQDDRGDPIDDPATAVNESQARKDGKIDIKGADLRVDGKRFGYFYGGVSHVEAEDSTSVSDLVKILNAGSGKELMERYWGFDADGNGKLVLVGGQYTLSLGTLLRYPQEFWGIGPDLYVSVFGIYGVVTSPVEEFDGQNMYKYGGELTYSMFSWLAASGRFDHVMTDTDDPTRSFAVFSPKLVFRSDWKTREALTLQYATYFLGSNVRVEGDNRLMNNPSGRPDKHLLALYGTIWW